MFEVIEWRMEYMSKGQNTTLKKRLGRVRNEPNNFYK